MSVLGRARTKCPAASPPTNFTNLLWARSTSETDLITNIGSPTVGPASSSGLLHIYVPSHIWPKQNWSTEGRSTCTNTARSVLPFMLMLSFRPLKIEAKKKNPAYFWFIKRQNYIQNIFFFLNDNNIMTINTNMLSFYTPYHFDFQACFDFGNRRSENKSMDHWIYLFTYKVIFRLYIKVVSFVTNNHNSWPSSQYRNFRCHSWTKIGFYRLFR